MMGFESPYNYNPSSINITLKDAKQGNNSNNPGNDPDNPGNNSDIEKIASAGKRTLPATGNPIIVALIALLAIGIGGLKRRL